MTSRNVILASFLVAATLGVAFIAAYWLHERKSDRAIISSVLFIGVMVLVHVLRTNQPARRVQAASEKPVWP